MKRFEDVLFTASQCKRELDQFGELLARENALLERKDLKPFFEAARQLSAFIGTYVSDIGPADLLAYEFQIAGDFAADVLVGNRQSQTFCMIELEEATSQDIFAGGGRRSTTEWS